jgi:hypothetical protein
MKIISFDVGIKNMAYCVFTKKGEHIDDFIGAVADIKSSNSECHRPELFDILDWNVVNLIEEPIINIQKTCEMALKNKKGSHICGKKAKYEIFLEGSPEKRDVERTEFYELRSQNSEIFMSATAPIKSSSLKNEINSPEKYSRCFCEKHAKMTEYIIPTKQHTITFLKKQKLGELQIIAQTHKIPDTNLTDKRQVLLEKIQKYYERMCLMTINTPKKRADEYSLIYIGQRIKKLFDEIPSMNGVTHVLIENQISIVASRMSIIQGLLTQYFIMRHEELSGSLHLEFISSKNKLKLFTDKQITNTSTSASQKYKQHKEDSIIYTKQLLEKYTNLHHWLPVLNTSKKDDLADCFLQGMWYINEKGIINLS